ncbi:MAG: hypothetical protein KIS92_19000 [Planctomycetota bacterium]|nr:hypothetical protein [Planctomycetota bacterium]
MGKAILFLILVGALVIGFVVYRSYTRATGKDPLAASASNEKKTTPAKEQKSGTTAGDLFQQANEMANETVKKGAAEVKDALRTKLGLSASPSPVELAPGKSIEVKISRGTKDLPDLKLTLEPPKDSGLKASGGHFAEGQKETTVTIEAPAGAKAMDTMVNLKFDDYTFPVPVKIK